MDLSTAPPYLEPYLRAAQQHGAGFRSLLWASPQTQAARFDAIARICPLAGKSVLDAGCGRADLLEFLLKRGEAAHDYVGLEAVDELAAAAEARALPNCRIVRCDFVDEPGRLFVGADVVVFSGSLNTLTSARFYATLRRAFDACAEAVVFNFLSSSSLAGREYLTWHRVSEVLAFARSIGRGGDVRSLEDYLFGDCTVLMRKQT